MVDSREDEIDKNTVKLIKDYNLLKQAKDLSKQLEPVAAALDRLQGDKVTMADKPVMHGLICFQMLT